MASVSATYGMGKPATYRAAMTINPDIMYMIITATEQPDVWTGGDHRAAIISAINITDAAGKSDQERNAEADLKGIEPYRV
jgi:hypothetical protein